jgi:phytoene desaturase
VGGLQEALAAGHLSNWQTLRALAGLDLHRTAAGVLRAHIRDSKLRQALGSFWQVSGSSPFRSPAVLAAFHHIQSRFGVWYPPGGMNRVAQALGHLVQDLGVLIRLGSPVEKILARGPRVTGVVTNGKTLPADAIVSNGDFVRTHRELLPDTATARRIEARPGAFEPTCSGVVFFFGLDRRYDQLRHHAFFFSRDPAREFEDIFERGVPTEDPTLSVCAPSRTDPSVAPDGCENVSVLVHAPSPRPGREESKLLGHTRALVIQKLERMGLEDFGRRIRVQHVQTPADVERLYGANRGALYGLASHGRLRGGFKPANRSADYENLYFAGGGANPGPGLPLSVMSGQIAANCFLKDAGVTNPSSLGD